MKRKLGRLVEQLVEADPEEVEVHDLDHGSHPGHRGAHAQPHDRRLRDRGVAHPLAEAVSQAPGQAEHVAAGTDVDPGEEHAIVARELPLQSVAHGIHGPVGRGLGRGWGRLGDRRPFAYHEVEERAGGRRIERPGLLDRLVEPVCDGGLERFELAHAHTGLEQAGTVQDQRVPRLPLLQLLGRAVALRITFVVAVPAIGPRFHE